MNNHTEGLVGVGKMILDFALVNRVTLHEDGVRPESDTDHTVMLSVCACALADSLYKNKLDIGKVAQFAIVHDLVEVHVGDTNTINLSKEGRANKDKKENESLKKIEEQFKDIYPWIHTTIMQYELRDTPEARFVKTLDKAMSKITNTLNKGSAIKKLGTTHEEIKQHFINQTEEYRAKYGKEFPELIDIIDDLMNHMLRTIYE